jgi:GntR family transcriptional regulator/MocR family aminotransferase
VAYLGTASKMLGPGVRLGWAVLPGDWVEDVVSGQRVTTRGLDVTSQLTFARFLDSYGYDRLVRSQRARYRRRVADLAATLAATGPYRTSGISAGGHVLVSLPGKPGFTGPEVERAVCAAAARRGLRLVGLDELRHGPTPRPPAIVLGYTRASAFAWPPQLEAFQASLRDVFSPSAVPRATSHDAGADPPRARQAAREARWLNRPT